MATENTPPRKINGPILIRTVTGLRKLELKQIVYIALNDRKPVFYLWDKKQKQLEVLLCSKRGLKEYDFLLEEGFFQSARQTYVNEYYLLEVTSERYIKLTVDVGTQLVMSCDAYAILNARALA